MAVNTLHQHKGTYNNLPVHIRILLNITERIAIRHPRANHIRVRSVVVAGAVERENILSTVLFPDLPPDADLAQEALAHLRCDLDASDDLDSDLLPPKVLAFPDIERRAPADRVVAYPAYLAMSEVDVRQERVGPRLDVVQVRAELDVMPVSWLILRHELEGNCEKQHSGSTGTSYILHHRHHFLEVNLLCRHSGNENVLAILHV